MQERERVLVAFSGGIDSYASAEALRDEGYDVELMTIDMLGSESFMEAAKVRAARLMMPLHVVDGRALFEREVVERFTREYLAGYTPAPCTLCNSHIKWELLAQEADRLGIYHISTGHYFRVVEHEGHLYVARGVDPRKDQSYYLWGVEEAMLQRVITPMGGRVKEEVMAASEVKRESMGICFLDGRHYTEFLCDRCGELSAGDIIDRESGKVVGRHNGIARYTIGQRRGEGIPPESRVVEIDGAQNHLIVGDAEALWSDRIAISNCHFIDEEEAFGANDIEVMIRGIGRNPEGHAHLVRCDDRVMIELDGGRAWAVAIKQPVALYRGDRVIGGGYITSLTQGDN